MLICSGFLVVNIKWEAEYRICIVAMFLIAYKEINLKKSKIYYHSKFQEHTLNSVAPISQVCMTPMLIILMTGN